jgi:hypothetical protein
MRRSPDRLGGKDILRQKNCGHCGQQHLAKKIVHDG